MVNNTYFAAKDAKECAAVLMGKVDAWSNNIESNGYLEKLRSAWSSYHGAYYSDASSGHKITFSGAEGEITNLPVNHLRNLAQHVLVMTTANRPSMEARATNTDYKSLTQTLLANGLLDYYMREKRLEKYLKTAVEYAIVMGAGYIKMSWNATSGELYDFNEDTQTPIYEGDVEFSNLSPFDVVVDSTKEDQKHDWILCRTWKNRHDLVAKYPEYADEILGLATKGELNKTWFSGFANDDTDDVAVYEFFHRRTEAVPDGRYLLFLSDRIDLFDGALPYRQLPVFRISPSDILGTPFGYTSVFDLLPLQDAVNSLYSTILTNQNAFGVQNILVPRGADIQFSQLAGGLNVIEANIQQGKPEALNLTSTPAEVFKFADMIKQEMETLSGVNSVARGNPEASLKSGAALALVQSMAIQFMSGLQQSYVQLIEDVGTALINMLKDFAAVPRVAAIAGRANRTYMKEFKGDDLSSVNRVIVDVGNPLARTTAGRVEMAQQLLQMNLITDPQQYFTVINTGKLDTMYEGTQAETMLIKGENEKMMNGVEVSVLDIDSHKEHIIEHKAILADPDLRDNPDLVKIVLAHIQKHIQSLQQADPNLLGLIGQQSLQPPPPPPGQPPQGGPDNSAPPNPGAPPPGGPATDVQAQMPGASMPNMPNIPSPPPPFQNNPTNPADVAQG
jgi:hypothetical protein